MREWERERRCRQADTGESVTLREIRELEPYLSIDVHGFLSQGSGLELPLGLIQATNPHVVVIIWEDGDPRNVKTRGVRGLYN
jgi:hypothetical protein